MKKILLLTAILAIGIILSPLGAWAVTIQESGLETVTLCEGAECSLTLTLENAGWAGTNTFGIYDADATTPGLMQIFSGSAAPTTTVNLSYHGSDDFLMGFYLTTTEGNGYTYYSETWRNPDKFDHFKIYENMSGYDWLICIEDIFGGGDQDFDDMVIGFNLTQNCNPVPIPGAVWLLGSGILGLAGLRRKFQA